VLSKVLTGRQTDQASAAAFPLVPPRVHLQGPGAAAGLDRHQRDETDANPAAGLAVLREKLQRLESQRAADARESHEAGRLEGERLARAELQPVLERLNASINEITGLRSDIRRRAERDTVQLALLIARRVLHRDLSVDDNALTAIARVAFERLTRSESYTIRVHPRFAAAITAVLPGVNASRVTIEADPGCAPGTLVIQSAEGVIDASIDSQMEEITRGLTDRLGSLSVTRR
jgi:flagellar assembly protein FliH